MATSFAPLHSRSNFSLLSGASSVQALLSRAQELGYSILALTDENTLSGACPFFQSAGEADIQPILGAHLTFREQAMTALIQDETGYAHLCSLLSRRHLREDFDLMAELPHLQEGLFILTEDPVLARRLHPLLDKDRLYIEIVRPGRPLTQEEELMRTARETGRPLVASSDVFFAREKDLDVLLGLMAIRDKTTISSTQERRSLYHDRVLRSPQEMDALYRDTPQALKNTLKIAEACTFQLLGRPVVFPRVEREKAQAIQRLQTMAWEGARKRYKTTSSLLRHRIERELDVIGSLGFADYFLVVADIVSYARSLGTPTAGRGSGASSVVSYVLGITNVDPLAYQLPFERFLHAERQDYPDLDIDFCWRLRDRIIQYVYDKYGDDHVAMVSTTATLRPRLAFRESARAHGLSDRLISRIDPAFHRGLPRSQWHTLPVEPPTLDSILSLAHAIQGFPHHLSVHCGGVLITPDPIERHAPLQRAEKGVVIVQYDKDAIEAVGLVKLDLLGNRAVSTLGEAMRILQNSQRSLPDPLPDRDPATVRLLQTGHTLGCNQLESPAMRNLLQMVRPSSIKDVMKVLALIRPGAASIGMKDAFVRRARGWESPDLQDPQILEILGETYGIMLYEDDALLVASHMAGLSPEKADRFRRAITKCRSDEERKRLSEDFLGRCERAGRDLALARDLWIQMAKFDSYSFCRAHAASYAVLSWALAFLKAHEPAIFWVSALNNNRGMYEKWVYVEAAKRDGIPFLLPCVNRSGPEFVLEGQSIRVGLSLLFGLSAGTLQRILRAREEAGSFQGLADFLRRVSCRLEEVAGLIKAGAFDFTGFSRPQLQWDLRMGYASGQKLCKETLLSLPCSEYGGPSLPDLSPRMKARQEWQMLRLSVGPHPLSWFHESLKKERVFSSASLSGHVGRTVRVAGLIAAGRDTVTMKGEEMGFITLDDQEGLVEVCLFPRDYARLRNAFDSMGPYIVEGVVKDQYDALSLTPTRVRRLGGGPVWPPGQPKRAPTLGCPYGIHNLRPV